MLAEYVTKRHGFGDTNGGFGVTYPGDLDDFDRDVEGACIPAGFVLAYGFWGLPDGDEVHVRESLFSEVVRQVLVLEGQDGLAEAVRAFQRSLVAPNRQ
jgi:hypothetical protein